MNIAICDDEQIFIDKIYFYLLNVSEKHNKKCNVFKCHSGDELIELSKKEKIDAVFLDISMPGVNGFETAEEILKIQASTAIVFVSSKENMVFSSYEYRPFWFVPKSQIAMLELVISRLITKIENEKKESVVISVENNKVAEIDFKKVAYFKTADHYVQIVLKDKSASNSYRNKLDNIEKQINEHWFVRVHNRYLVNLRMISTIEKTECVLTNGETIPISRAKMAKTKQAFQNYLRSIR